MTDSNVKIFLHRSSNLLTFLGMWLTTENSSVLYRIYTLFIMVTQFSFVLFEFAYTATVLGDIDALSEASNLLFTQASVCLKSSVFLVNKKNLVVLMQLMNSDIFAPQTEQHRKILFHNSRTIKRLCIFFLVSALSTVTLWAVVPLLDDVRTFPFTIWMPVSPEKSPQYELGYIYQIMSIYISALLFIGVDSVSLSMIMFGCAQLKIIMAKLEKLQKVPLSAKLRPDERRERLHDNNKVFNECIQQHQAIIRFIEIVEDTYHANIFFQLGGTVAIICIIGLRITIVEPQSVQFFSMVNYMVTMLSQLFLYCWCGNELTTRSQELRECMYLCPWYEQDEKFKKSLWIAMERMKKPIIFKAGHYIPLSRPTFVAILRSSYSYFAVLNQANSK